ncbi:MAG TPA: PQQ-binding-like beta-propeller repeat protein [Candidatus Aquilonibacter sp.]|nr:PQQ-binding-like beta-propeller repeat protein [Candidatus Aquilonibacter sp.]
MLACLVLFPATQRAQQSQPSPQTQQVPAPPLVGPPARIAAQGLFNSYCASCHQNVMASAAGVLGPKSAPSTETLGQMTPEAIYAALTAGAMVGQARNLTNDQKRMIAEFFGGRPLGSADAGDAKNMAGHCRSNPPLADPSAEPSWNGWGNGPANTRFQPAAAAQLSAGQVPSLKLKWAFGIPDGAETYGQPAIVSGRVFFGDYNGFVYSLDAATGCVYWSFHADAQVRTAIVVGRVKGNGSAKYAAYFGDKKANVYAVDTQTGKLLWRVNPEPRLLEHVTGGAALYEGRVFVGVAGSEEMTSMDPHYPCCTYRGSLSALDAGTGKIIWKTYTIADAARPTKKNSLGTQLWGPAGASIWTTPTIDPQRNAVYVGTGNAFSGAAAKTSDAIVAFDIKTGKIVWSYQALANDVSPAGCNGNGPRGEQCPENPGPDWDFGNSPILETLPGGQRLLVAAHKGGLVVAIDPDRGGALVWKTDLAEPDAGDAIQVMWGGASDGENVYYSLKSGGVAAVRLADGKRVWTARIDPAVIPSEAGKRVRRGLEAAVTGIPGVVFAGGWDGVLHALSAEDGHVLWEFQTVRDYTTVNGVAAHGGSLGAPGPVVVDGMLYVGSGYVGTGNGIPGNVLLALSPQ